MHVRSWVWGACALLLITDSCSCLDHPYSSSFCWWDDKSSHELHLDMVGPHDTRHRVVAARRACTCCSSLFSPHMNPPTLRARHDRQLFTTGAVIWIYKLYIFSSTVHIDWFRLAHSSRYQAPQQRASRIRQVARSCFP